jgi:hypothetical protein
VKCRVRKEFDDEWLRHVWKWRCDCGADGDGAAWDWVLILAVLHQERVHHMPGLERAWFDFLAWREALRITSDPMTSPESLERFPLPRTLEGS